MTAFMGTLFYRRDNVITLDADCRESGSVQKKLK